MNRPALLALHCLLITSVAFCEEETEPLPPLKEAFAGSFHVGVAVATPTILAPDENALGLIRSQFNSLTSENLFKWAEIHPEQSRYNFTPADRLVSFGKANQMQIVGHTLVWHNQTPAWVFRDDQGEPLGRDALLERMSSHIHAVVGRYRGRVQAWDVVNEALNDDGSLRDSPWRRIIGDDFLEHAFKATHQADPDAELYYNDYNMHLPKKRDGAVRLVASLKQAGCRVDGIGMQGHWALDYPSEAEIDASITAFSQAAGKVMITELDVNVLPRPGNRQGADLATRGENTPSMDPYKSGLPPEVSQRQAERYAMFFRVFMRHRDSVDRVTLWGLDDGLSWHNNWPIRGRTAHSLLFNRSLAPKPALVATLRTARLSED